MGNKSNKNIYRIKSGDFEKIEDVYGYLKKGFDKYIYNFVVEYKSETEMKFSCEKDTSFYRKGGINPFHKVKCHIKRTENEENETEFKVKFETEKPCTFAGVAVLLFSLLIFAILMLRGMSTDDIVFILRAFCILDVIFIWLLSAENFNNYDIMKKFRENIESI